MFLNDIHFPTQNTAPNDILLPDGLTYQQKILSDMFTTDVPAPLPATANAEPGPGRRVKRTDSANRVSISGGYLVQSSGGGSLDPYYYWTDNAGNGFSRVVGRTLIFSVGAYQSNKQIGLTSAVIFAGAPAIYAKGVVRGSNTALNAFVLTVGSPYSFAISLQSIGALAFVKGGAYGQWTLAFRHVLGTDATLWPGFNAQTDGGTVNALDSMELADVFGTFATDYGLAKVYQAAPVDGTIYTSVVATVTVFNFTLPGSPASGDLAELRYRVQDANNYMLARVQWNNGTSQWDFVTGHVIAGVETLQGTPVANVGSVISIEVQVDGNSHVFWTLTGTAYTQRYGTITDANHNTRQGVAVHGVNATLGILESYARTDSEYNRLDNTPP